ncbi:MAG: hypothetical protein AAF720_02325 [Pseudomonadota bacterium]
MGKQYSTHYISWRDADRAPLGIFVNEHSYAAAACRALEKRIAELTNEGWIVDRIIPSNGLTPKQCAGYTIVAFK